MPRAYPPDCDPDQVAAELDRLWDEFTAQPRVGGSWAVLAGAARWTQSWQTRRAAQWSRLGVWARATGQPHAVWRAILAAEHHCVTTALRAQARAVKCEREAAEEAARVGAVA
ncbi:MAG: hypothetical protein M3Z25_17585 [Actinomycetota bacterium]|nr:hypothetical protein [Actinomycetota bacterium]